MKIRTDNNGLFMFDDISIMTRGYTNRASISIIKLQARVEIELTRAMDTTS